MACWNDNSLFDRTKMLAPSGVRYKGSTVFSCSLNKIHLPVLMTSKLACGYDMASCSPASFDYCICLVACLQLYKCEQVLLVTWFHCSCSLEAIFTTAIMLAVYQTANIIRPTTLSPIPSKCHPWWLKCSLRLLSGYLYCIILIEAEACMISMV